MHWVHLVTVLVFAVIIYDGRRGRSKHVSAQTCVGMVMAFLMSVFNLPHRWESRCELLAILAAGSLLGVAASIEVIRSGEANGEDDLTIPGLPHWLCKAVPYVGAVCMSLISLFAACHFSVAESISFALQEPRAVSCTLQNFLHVTALLPQLVFSHRLGFVSPAAVRFLVLVGLNHMYEFITDALVSVENYQNGTFSMHEFSFMSGDFCAAVVLIDFMCIVATSRHSLFSCSMALELPLQGGDDRFNSETTSKPCVQRFGWPVFLHTFFADGACRRERLAASLAVLAIIGVCITLGLINWIFLLVGCMGTLAFQMLNASYPRGFVDKTEKCAV
eukprot:TRINITY_DN27077_c0_g1_i1.p1 TRINITY_DN27077_c0_g1~~TRINITY_DN27077_c0_g1_i1.p1  ORF type:complete len:333 (+),score=35.32 TRINITY_DN27077_c0_g1_i1:60-1058(+)